MPETSQSGVGILPLATQLDPDAARQLRRAAGRYIASWRDGRQSLVKQLLPLTQCHDLLADSAVPAWLLAAGARAGGPVSDWPGPRRDEDQLADDVAANFDPNMRLGQRRLCGRAADALLGAFWLDRRSVRLYDRERATAAEATATIRATLADLRRPVDRTCDRIDPAVLRLVVMDRLRAAVATYDSQWGRWHGFREMAEGLGLGYEHSLRVFAADGVEVMSYIRRSWRYDFTGRPSPSDVSAITDFDIPLTSQPAPDRGPLLTCWREIVNVLNEGRPDASRFPHTEAGHKRIRRLLDSKPPSPVRFGGRGEQPCCYEGELRRWLAGRIDATSPDIDAASPEFAKGRRTTTRPVA